MSIFFYRLREILLRNDTKEEVDAAVCNTMIELSGDHYPHYQKLSQDILEFVMKVQCIPLPNVAWGIIDDRDERCHIKIAQRSRWVTSNLHSNWVGGSVRTIDEFWEDDELRWVKFSLTPIEWGSPMVFAKYYPSGRLEFGNGMFRGVYDGEIFTFTLHRHWLDGLSTSAHLRATADDVSIWFTYDNEVPIAEARHYQEA